ncbi:unnamed protein product [Cunninghamella echinulata]
MPLFQQYIQRIKNTSALHVLCQIEKKKKASIPFPTLENKIKEIYSTEGKKLEGIYYGDTIELYGKTNTGKTYIVSQFIEHTLKHQDNTKVLYINLTQKPLKNNDNLICDKLYYFQPMDNNELIAFIYGIEKWFYDHHQPFIGWVVIDGEWVEDRHQEDHQEEKMKLLLLRKLKSLQYHWSFILLYTNRSKTLLSDSSSREPFYQIECYKKDSTIGVKLL